MREDALARGGTPIVQVEYPHVGVSDPGAPVAPAVPPRRRSWGLDLATWREGLCPSGDWSRGVSRPEDAAAVARSGRWTLRGCPLGSASFVRKVERLVGRRLHPLPVARPRKESKNENTASHEWHEDRR